MVSQDRFYCILPLCVLYVYEVVKDNKRGKFKIQFLISDMFG